MGRRIPEALLQRARELRQQQTPAEQVLWECLRDRRLNEAKFRRQHNIGRYIADFYCHQARLVIEVDGSSHDNRNQEDAIRDRWLTDNNFKVLRFTNHEVLHSTEQVLNTIVINLTSSKILPSPLRRGVGGEVDRKLLVACNNDRQLWERVRPFVDLIRNDTFGYPLIIPAGSVYVTQGSNRRETGTHYTPKSLTEEIVRYTLEPLVYEGVAEGKPKEKWQLISPAELLNLKIADIAMGSGAFLVQVCRYLGEKLVEAWEAAETANPGKVVIAPEGILSKSRPEECIIPIDEDEKLIFAKRIIAERCVYGVDKNPLAVEMAKLSLWLETLQKSKPFTFVDHALKSGDSLIGVNLEQLRRWNLDVTTQIQLDVGSDRLWQEIDEAISLRQRIEAKPVSTPQDQKEKARLLAEANARINDLRDRANLLISSYLADVSNSEREALRQRLLLVAQNGRDVSESDRAILPKDLPTFHWDLEFPEVFLTSPHPNGHLSPSKRGEGGEVHGFHALVGNPPFMGGKKITGVLGTTYRDYLVEWVAKNVRGNADLCAYFFLRGQQLIKNRGGMGLVATNTIAQGDTREVGLDQLMANGCVIPRAVPSRKWEGTASLEVAYVWLRRGEWKGEFILDEKPVSGITPFLTVPGKAVGNPFRLVANQANSYIGAYILGTGWILTPEEAQALIEKDPRNQDVLFPYLNGEDLNSRPDQSPSRWVINFKDYPLDAEHDEPKKPKGHPYAADYPDCLAIIEEKVKPERAKNNRKVYRERWWQYAEKQAALYKAIAGRDRVLVRARVSNTNSIAFVPKGLVMSEMIVVFNFDDYASFALLQAMTHTEWLTYHSSTLGAGTRYTPSDCFETFPFPVRSEGFSLQPSSPEGLTTTNLEQIGETYYTHRQNIMQTRQEGLTKTYNRFHNPEETSEDIVRLRQLHVEMDYAVAAAYGWDDLIPSPKPGRGAGGEGLNHNFHETKQGLRYTISETARREVLDRLLQLNHQRYREEVEQGLHDKKKKKAKSGSKKKAKIDTSLVQGELF